MPQSIARLHRQTLLKLIRYFIASSLLAWLVSGCGFSLQTKAIIAYKTIFISGSPSPKLRYQLMSTIPIFTSATITQNPALADLILVIERDEVNSSILAYSATGQITAFALNNLLGFYAYDQEGVSVMTERNIYVVRDMNFTVSTVLAAEIQQQQLVQDMKAELAMQIVRQLMAQGRRLGLASPAPCLRSIVNRNLQIPLRLVGY